MLMEHYSLSLDVGPGIFIAMFPAYSNSLIRNCRAQSKKRNDNRAITCSLTTDKPRQRIENPCVAGKSLCTNGKAVSMAGRS
jgi:hypothetical protein